MTESRSRLVVRVKARLHRYARDDHDAVLDSAALKEVATLLDAVRIDSQAAPVCGLLLWCRSLHDPDGTDDLISALALLEPVWRVDPTKVPEGIADYFAEYGLGPVKVTDKWQGLAHSLAQCARRSGDAEAGALAVALMRRTVSATPTGDPERGAANLLLSMGVQDVTTHSG